MYVYKRTESQLWTVGYYAPNGRWEPESDWDSPGKAAERVHYLNGSCCDQADLSPAKIIEANADANRYR